MKLEIDTEYKRTLKARKNEVFCQKCGKNESKRWFFCEQNHVLYCNECMLHYGKAACSAKEDHLDVAINEVIIDDT